MSQKSKNKKVAKKSSQQVTDAMNDAAEALFEQTLDEDGLIFDEAANFEDESDSIADVEGSELESFDSAEVEAIEDLDEEHMCSVVESLLFSTDKPISVNIMKSAFQGTGVKVSDIRKAIEALRIEYDARQRGVVIDEVAGGFQLRTKPENMKFLKQTLKARPFKLSGPALEVLSIVAYKQPCIKMAVDEIRGVESGHLMRGLLDRGILRFAGKSELPGRPMLYETTKKFLEIFGLRNIEELPSLNEIDQILPDGIDESTEEKETLSDLTGRLSEEVGTTFSQAEEELGKITDELQAINTSTDFFEKEKERQRAQRDSDRAQDIREKLLVGEDVNSRDRSWLERYELTLMPEVAATEAIETEVTEADTTTEEVSADPINKDTLDQILSESSEPGEDSHL